MNKGYKHFVSLLQECDRKEADYASQAVELRKKYATSCKQMGIEVSYCKPSFIQERFIFATFARTMKSQI